MNIKSLTLKNTLIDEKTGESYFDLTAPSFKYVSEYGIKSIHYVAFDQAGRVDLVSDQYFGTTEYVDAICIINNIFNPFSIQEGDLLIIPNLKNPQLFYSRPKTIQKPDSVQSQYIETNRQSEKDQSRIQRLIQKAKNKKNGVKSPLPPNVLQPGENVKEFAKGKIKLGTNLNTRNR